MTAEHVEKPNGKVPSADGEKAPLAALGDAVELVGGIFGTQADCATAAALLCEIGRHLGYKLSVRPVSLIASQPSTETIVVMGPKALERFPKSALRTAHSKLLNGENTGHVVVTCEDPTLLLDANLPQLAVANISAPILMAKVGSTHPESGEWQLRPIEDLDLLYILDEDNDGLIHDFHKAMANFSDEAEHFAKLIRAGASASYILGELAQIPGYLRSGTIS